MSRSLFKRIIFFLGVFVINFSVVSAEVVRTMECEYTDAYKKWLKMSEKERQGILEPNMCKTNDMFYTYVGTGNITESFTSTKFDLRDYNYVTGIKNQGESNSCWAFATAASIESNSLLNSKGEYDLSEAHMELATQNSKFNGLVPFNRTFNVGGNFFVSSAYLLNRVGPVLENDVPFSLINNIENVSPTLNDISNKKVQFSINDITFLSGDSGACSIDAISSVKKYLVSNGAIGASIYFAFTNQLSLDGTKVVDQFTKGAYYYYDGSSYASADGSVVDIKQNPNHAVTIIGWDDTISASNFYTKPTRDGAWIVKNSYGTNLDTSAGTVDMGDNGYYYVSYDDINICTALTGFSNIDKNIEDNAYFYDELGVNTALNSTSDIYLANVFSKKTSSSEILKKVTFFGGIPNQKYDIYYSDNENLSNLTKISSGVVNKIGYTTVDVSGITLTTSKYAIIVKYYLVDGANRFYIYGKESNSIYNMDVPSGVSFFSQNGIDWGEFSYSNKNYLASIRAYTNNGSTDTGNNGNTDTGNNGNTDTENNGSTDTGNNGNTDTENNGSDDTGNNGNTDNSPTLIIDKNPANSDYINSDNNISDNPETGNKSIIIVSIIFVILICGFGGYIFYSSKKGRKNIGI